VSLNKPFLVDVIGFNPVERSMLSSIFALAARRDPGFVQYDPAAGGSAHIYLVDADSPESLGEFQALGKRGDLRAVLIGTAQAKAGSIVLARPLQWARLLQALEDTAVDLEPDLMLGDSLESSANDASLPLGRSRPGTTRSDAGSSTASESARKRALGDTVLVVDDNATVRLFMKAKLAPFGFEVDYAETGEEAVGLTGSQEYTCVFLDVVLPGIDGYQVCKMIKSNKQAIKKTAVVMLTSRNSPFDKLRGSLAGCDEYLTKPLDEDRLLEVIAKFLPSSRRRESKQRNRGHT
jgi:two-component system cell cycle response regulator